MILNFMGFGEVVKERQSSHKSCDVQENKQKENSNLRLSDEVWIFFLFSSTFSMAFKILVTQKINFQTQDGKISLE